MAGGTISSRLAVLATLLVRGRADALVTCMNRKIRLSAASTEWTA
jgi:hypothetical protein